MARNGSCPRALLHETSQNRKLNSLPALLLGPPLRLPWVRDPLSSYIAASENPSLVLAALQTPLPRGHPVLRSRLRCGGRAGDGESGWVGPGLCGSVGVIVLWKAVRSDSGLSLPCVSVRNDPETGSCLLSRCSQRAWRPREGYTRIGREARAVC